MVAETNCSLPKSASALDTEPSEATTRVTGHRGGWYHKLNLLTFNTSRGMKRLSLGNCPQCGSSRIRWSRYRTVGEILATIFLLRVARCHGCMHRHYRPLLSLPSKSKPKGIVRQGNANETSSELTKNRRSSILLGIGLLVISIFWHELLRPTSPIAVHVAHSLKVSGLRF